MPTVYPPGLPETLPSAASPPISRQTQAAAPSRRETILSLVELLLQQNEESAQGVLLAAMRYVCSFLPVGRQFLKFDDDIDGGGSLPRGYVVRISTED